MFAKRLSELRKSKNMKQRELAKEIGVTRSMLSLYEAGKRDPSVDILRKLAIVFGVTTDYLLGKTDMLSPPVDSLNLKYIELIKEWEEEGMTPEEIRELWETLGTIAKRYRRSKET